MGGNLAVSGPQNKRGKILRLKFVRRKAYGVVMCFVFRRTPYALQGTMTGEGYFFEVVLSR